MACIGSRSYIRRFCRNLRSTNVIYGCNQRLEVRNISYTSCLMKSSENKPKNDDLDFFGLEEMQRNDEAVTIPRSDNVISPSERRFLKNLVDSHYKPKKKKIPYFETGVGRIRYDRSLPQTESGHIPTLKQNASQSRSISEATMKRKKRHDRNNSKNDTEMSVIDEQYFPDATGRRHSIEHQTSHQSGWSFVDEQYFEYNRTTSENTKSTSDDNLDRIKCEHSTTGMSDNLSFVDEQYIGHSLTSRSETPTSFVENTVKEESKSSVDNTFSEASFFDEQYFDQNSDYSFEKPTDYSTKKVTAHGGTTFIDEQYIEDNLHVDDNQAISSEKRSTASRINKRNQRDRKQKPKFESDAFGETQSLDFTESSLDEVKHVNKRERKTNTRVNTERNDANETEPQGAYDLAMKLRKDLQIESDTFVKGAFDPKQYDSQGFKILKNQVPHLENVPSIDVVKLLRQSIIYNRNDIVAISKPYGLISDGGPGVLHSVIGLSDKIIPNTPLYLVRKLLKEATGVMLFAKTQEMALKLDDCFLKREVEMRYLAITKGIPTMNTGEIDIPISEGKVGGRTRMCLRPYRTPELNPVFKSRMEGDEAITRYRVLDAGTNCAVIECMPLTGVKHQIRVHLAFGLNCPILGDHKYAHSEKMAPMRLHPEMLKQLKIQQSKVRYVPMHLHARSIVIPEFFDGRNLYISAPLPPHFVRNLQDLKMKLPRHA